MNSLGSLWALHSPETDIPCHIPQDIKAVALFKARQVHHPVYENTHQWGACGPSQKNQFCNLSLSYQFCLSIFSSSASQMICWRVLPSFNVLPFKMLFWHGSDLSIFRVCSPSPSQQLWEWQGGQTATTGCVDIPEAVLAFPLRKGPI